MCLLVLSPLGLLGQEGVCDSLASKMDSIYQAFDKHPVGECLEALDEQVLRHPAIRSCSILIVRATSAKAVMAMAKMDSSVIQKALASMDSLSQGKAWARRIYYMLQSIKAAEVDQNSSRCYMWLNKAKTMSDSIDNKKAQFETRFRMLNLMITSNPDSTVAKDMLKDMRKNTDEPGHLAILEKAENLYASVFRGRAASLDMYEKSIADTAFEVFSITGQDLLMNYAFGLYQAGNLRRALSITDTIIAVCRYLGHPVPLCKALLNRGLVASSMERHEEALPFLLEARQISVDHKLNQPSYEALHNLAVCYAALDSGQKARETIEKLHEVNKENIEHLELNSFQWAREIEKNELLALRLKLEEKESESNFRFGLSVLAFSLLLLAFLVMTIKAYRKSQSTNLALEKSNRLNRQLLALIAHDLRSPIASFSNFIHQNEKSRLSHELVAEMKSKTQQALLLIENLLNWASDQFKNHEKTTKTLFSMKHLIMEVTTLYQEMYASEMEIRVVHNPNLFVWANRDQIRSILLNMLNNAQKFGEQTIEVNSQRRGEEMEIRITDDGAHTQKSQKESGWGIGLQVIQRFAKANRGRFSLEVKQGETVASLYLPLPKKEDMV